MSLKSDPKVSIIIPFYNSVKYLRRCVESMAGQSYAETEIILVDDGSSDGSAQLAEELAAADAHIRILQNGHSGVSSARNAGLKDAAGTYILFVDSDDWMELTAVEHMVEQMLQTDADLVTCELAFSDGSEAESTDGQEVHAQHETAAEAAAHTNSYSREEYLRLFFRIDSNEWVHFPVAKLYKKELLPQPLYPEDIRVGEDVMGTYRALLQVKNIVRIREVGYYYYNNPDSVTMHFSEKDFDLLEVWDQLTAMTAGRDPDHAYAKINRERINFTLLFRMITEVPAAEIREYYGFQQQKLRADLCSCEKELLASPIVASRKVLIRLLCHCYPVMAAAGNAYVLYKRAHGKAPGLTRRKLS